MVGLATEVFTFKFGSFKFLEQCGCQTMADFVLD